MYSLLRIYSKVTTVLTYYIKREILIKGDELIKPKCQSASDAPNMIVKGL